jgi:hypothetical protein
VGKGQIPPKQEATPISNLSHIDTIHHQNSIAVNPNDLDVKPWPSTETCQDERQQQALLILGIPLEQLRISDHNSGYVEESCSMKHLVLLV